MFCWKDHCKAHTENYPKVFDIHLFLSSLFDHLFRASLAECSFWNITASLRRHTGAKEHQRSIRRFSQNPASLVLTRGSKAFFASLISFIV